MRSTGLVIAAIALVGVLGGGIAPAQAGRADWSSSDACGVCHVAESTAWRATPHATTGARLPVRSPARCLVCHATGEAPAGPTMAAGVGCEACHGAGASYSPADVMLDVPLASLLGLANLSTPEARLAVCERCHIPGLRLDAAGLEGAMASVHPVAPVAEAATP